MSRSVRPSRNVGRRSPRTREAQRLRRTGLTPLEVASGLLFGFTPGERLPGTNEGESRTPRGALERAILPGLLRPPCLVGFSGGRGSSVVLALAVDVARREGLATSPRD